MRAGACWPDGGAAVLKEFFLPEQDVYQDDGWHSGIYPVGFTHPEPPTVVQPGQEAVWVTSRGGEGDDFLFFGGAGELAGAYLGMPGTRLDLPTGQNREEVANLEFRLECPPVVGSDFRYAVDVVYSVHYVP